MADPQVRTIVQGLGKFTERTVIRLVLNVTANLVEDTPIDLGWARANWVPAAGRSDDTPKASNVTSSAVSAQASVQAAATAGILTYRLPQGAVYVSNNVPYIPRLNDGYSSQAPAGFVQAGIRRAIGQTERQLR